jgi:hypothetical protein
MEIGDAGGKALGATLLAMPPLTLKSIDLRSCGLGRSAAEDGWLGSFVGVLRRYEERMVFGQSGGAMYVRGGFVGLTHLWLGGNLIGEADLTTLLGALPTAVRLIDLDIQDTTAPTEGYAWSRALSTALIHRGGVFTPAIRALERLIVSGFDGAGNAMAAWDVLSHLPELRFLRVGRSEGMVRTGRDRSELQNALAMHPNSGLDDMQWLTVTGQD